MADSNHHNNDDIRYIARSIAAASVEMTAFANQIRPLVASALETQHRIAQMTAPIRDMQQCIATVSRSINAFKNSLSAYSEMHDTLAQMSSGLGKIAKAAAAYKPLISEIYRRMPTQDMTLNDTISDVDFEILGQATDDVLSHENTADDKTDSDNTPDSDDDINELAEVVAEKIAEKYNLSLQSSDTQHHISVEVVISIFSLLVNLILGLPGCILSTKELMQNDSDKPKVIYQQQVRITNNYYQFMSGASIDELNDANFRIVAQNIVVRIKHDCHSHVVDRLEAGDVVQVIGKYRKWRHIEWTDEDNHLRIGWMQNYKLAKFRIITS